MRCRALAAAGALLVGGACASPHLECTAGVAAPFRWTDGFEDPAVVNDLLPADESRWTSTQLQGNAENALSIVSAPVHGGTSSLRTHAGAYDGFTASKADVGKGGLSFGCEQDFWASVWLFIEGNANTENLFLLDVEVANNSGSPGRRVYLTGGDAVLACDAGKFPVAASTVRQPRGQEKSLAKNQWTHLELHLHLSDDETRGLVEAWQDDVKVLDANSRTLPLNDVRFDRVQVGLTANGNTAQPHTLFVDDVTISNQALR